MTENSLDDFLADFPFRCFIPEENEPTQTAEQAKVMIQKAEAKKQRIRTRNLNSNSKVGCEPNHRDIEYTSKRGERRRYQLGRD